MMVAIMGQVLSQSNNDIRAITELRRTLDVFPPEMKVEYFVDLPPFITSRSILEESFTTIGNQGFHVAPSVIPNQRLWIRLTMDLDSSALNAFDGFIYFGRHDRIFCYIVEDYALVDLIKIGGLYKSHRPVKAMSNYYLPVLIEPGRRLEVVVQLSDALHRVDSDPVVPVLLHALEVPLYEDTHGIHWMKPLISISILTILTLLGLICLLLFAVYRQSSLLYFGILCVSIVLHNIRVLEYYLDRAVIWGHWDEYIQKMELPLRLLIMIGFLGFAVTHFDLGVHKKWLRRIVILAICIRIINALAHFVYINPQDHFPAWLEILYGIDVMTDAVSSIVALVVLWILKTGTSRIFALATFSFILFVNLGMYMTSTNAVHFNMLFSGDLIVLIAVLVFLLFIGYMVYRQLDEMRQEWWRKAAHSEQVEELHRSKSRFFANVTHDFRTPITVIGGLIQRIESPSLDQSIIKRNLDKLQMLVDEMMDISKLEVGKLIIDFSQFDLVALVEEVNVRLSTLAQKRAIKTIIFSRKNPLIIESDRAKLDKIIANLLSNAIEYTPSSGRIVVVMADAIHWIYIEVRDNGFPIAEDMQKNIFERYKSSPTPSKTHSGLGLAIVGELVKSLGGNIQLSSSPKGNSFRIALPNRLVEEVSVPLYTTHEQSNELVGQDSYQILIIEDNIDLLYYYQTILSPRYHIHTAKDGLEGLRVAEAEVPDLIVTDIMMPNMDGVTMTRVLKENRVTHHIPILVVSAKGSASDRLDFWRAGADYFLQKGFQQVELLAKIEGIFLNLRRQQAYIRQQLSMPDSKEENIDPFIKELHSFITSRMDDTELSIEDLCRFSGLSRSQLFRRVKSLTGLNPTKFMLDSRLEQAWQLLKSRDQRVNEVAYQCGFSDPAYFARVFKRAYGRTPSEHQHQIFYAE